MFNKLGKLIPTILLILFAVISSMMLLSYFDINMNTKNNLILNRYAVFEGMKENMILEEEEKKKKKTE